MFGFFAESYVLKHRISNELKAVPAVQLDKKQFRRQYRLNKAEWDAVIDFLRDTDLEALTPGRHNITEKTFVNVSTYTTRTSGEFEAHRDYIDLQYLLKGKEIIEVAPLSKAGKVTKPYSKEADIEFFESAGDSDEILINEDVFSILFPDQLHKPCMVYESPCEVLKLVVKIPFIK